MQQDINHKAPPASVVKPVLAGPKRQHFLPRFYLEGFAEDGLLAVYDRESDEVRLQQPVNTAVIGHFYTFDDVEGRRRFDLEQMLSEFEAKARVGIRKFASRQDLTDEEHADLAIFVSLACFRTPDIVDSLKLFHSRFIRDMTKTMFADVEQVKNRIRGGPGAPTDEDALEQEARELVEFAQSGHYKVVTSNKWAMGRAMMLAFNVAPILAGRTWTITHRRNEAKSFVTADAPVVLTTVAPRAREESFWGIGFGNSDALVYFPLTQACALVISGQEGHVRHVVVDTDALRFCNLTLAERCQRYVIGRDEALVRSLANRLGLAGKAWQPKMQAR